MTRVPALGGWDIVRALEKAGFQTVRQKGSHVRMRRPDAVLSPSRFIPVRISDVASCASRPRPTLNRRAQNESPFGAVRSEPRSAAGGATHVALTACEAGLCFEPEGSPSGKAGWTLEDPQDGLPEYPVPTQVRTSGELFLTNAPDRL